MKELIIIIVANLTPLILGIIYPEWKAIFYQVVMILALLAWQIESYRNKY